MPFSTYPLMRDLSLDFPFRGRNAESVLLNGFALSVLTAIILDLPAPFSVLSVFPLTILVGYYARVVEITFAGRSTPPKYDSYPTLGRQGLTLIAVTIAYVTPVMLYFFALVRIGGVGAAVVANPADPPLLVYLVGSHIFVVVAVTLYSLPVAYAKVVQTASFRSVFHVRKHLRMAFTRRYFRYWLPGCGILVVAGVVGTTLWPFGPIGELGGIFVIYYASLITVRRISLGLES